MTGRAYVMEGNRVEERGPGEDGAAGQSSTGLTDLLGTGPLFEIARRGYDRLAVDAYVQEAEEDRRSLRRQLHAVLERYHAAATALVDARRRPEDRADEILAEARAEAQARMANVTALREAATVAREEARRERTVAAAELTRARQEASALREEAERVRADAEASVALRRAALESEMADLRRQRDEARAQLRRLTGQIERALQSLTAVLPDDASALTEGREPVAG